MKAFLNLFILLLCVGSAVVIVSVYGENPLMVPVVRVSAASGKCLSVATISEGKEVEKSCDVFGQIKREGRRYNIQYSK